MGGRNVNICVIGISEAERKWQEEGEENVWGYNDEEFLRNHKRGKIWNLKNAKHDKWKEESRRLDTLGLKTTKM